MTGQEVLLVASTIICLGSIIYYIKETYFKKHKQH